MQLERFPYYNARSKSCRISFITPCRRDNTSITVLAGSNTLDGTKGKAYKSKSIVLHEKYDSPYNNNIGLVKVNRDIKFSDKIQPIDLPRQEFVRFGVTGVFAGWGSKYSVIQHCH
jgi:hypothetical protein